MHMTEQTLKEKFFQGMSFTPATVNVITSDGPAGRVGLTVSAMSSVSADTVRPTLLICINENSAAAASILENGVFCVNVLHSHQSYISDAFAGRYKDRLTDKFDCTQWQICQTGSPRVAEALVGFDCEIQSTVKIGTHHVIFGEVVDITIADKGSALIYANRSYGASQPIIIPEIANFNPCRLKAVNSGQPLSLGCFHTFAAFFVPALIRDLTDQGEGLSVKLVEGDNRRIKEALLAGEVDVALLYDFDLPEAFETVLLSRLTPYVLISKDHPLASQSVISDSDLHGSPMISIAEDVSCEKLEGELKARGVEPKVVFRAASLEMMRGMVGQGLGFGLAMTQTGRTKSYDGKELISKPLKTPLPSQSIVLAKRRDEALSNKAASVFAAAQASPNWG